MLMFCFLVQAKAQGKFLRKGKVLVEKVQILVEPN